MLRFGRRASDGHLCASDERNAHKSSARATTTITTAMTMMHWRVNNDDDAVGIIIVDAACRVTPKLPRLIGAYHTNSHHRQ